MSIAVVVGVHDGVVIGADSASTLTVSAIPGAVAGVANVYDNAYKVFNLYKGLPIGCVTFGAGGIGSSSIGTLVKDLRAMLMDPAKATALGFDAKKYTMEQVSQILAKFLNDEMSKQNPASLLGASIGFLIAGYSSDASLAETWAVDIQAGKPATVQLMRPADQPGVAWGGFSEVIQRIILGFSPAIFQVLAHSHPRSVGSAPC